MTQISDPNAEDSVGNSSANVAISTHDAPIVTQRTSVATDVSLVATFAALIAVCSLVSAPVGPGGVPITLQTFAVLLVGLTLGARRGFLAVALYLVVGFAGIPVFAGGTGGLSAFASPSAGYLLAFPLAAAVAGGWMQLSIRRSWRPHVVHGAIAVAIATLLVYAAGIPVLAWRAGMTMSEAFVANFAFVPFDLIKAAVAVVVALAVGRAFPALLRTRSASK